MGTYTRTFYVLTEATGSGTCDHADGYEEEVECTSPCPVEGCMDSNVHKMKFQLKNNVMFYLKKCQRKKVIQEKALYINGVPSKWFLKVVVFLSIS